MNQDVATTLRWLVDRAQISDLLFSFAAALDNKNWQAYADNFADGGYIDLPDLQSTNGSRFTLHKDKMLEMLPKSLGRYTATHHISSNHQISIEGDAARSRSYLQGVHVGAKPVEHWTAGGWYDCRYMRTAIGGWKFAEVRLTAVWLDGDVGAIKPD
jgi:hypothetical protein